MYGIVDPNLAALHNVGCETATFGFNYARSPSGNPKGGGPSLADNYMQLSHFHQVRALCDMSMEQQVRDYLNHCPVSSEAGGTLGPPGAPPPPPPGCLGSRILSRNANGTIAMTSQPTNESELQLYRVLQRANLLSYYDTFICQGGDDVQQLCEAGEEEFLEIMALVGMASKPLHVRRLQKALQEWVNNPAMFQTPLVPSLPPGHPGSGHPGHPGLAPLGRPAPPVSLARPSPPMGSSHSSPSPGLGPKETPSPSRMHHPPPMATPQPPSGYSQNSVAEWRANQEPHQLQQQQQQQQEDRPGSPPCPVLSEAQIRRLAEAAEALVRSLPPHAFADPRPHGRRMCKDLEHVLSMSEEDPRRMDEIRKYAAIYGRFDCKRKPAEKPLTLHEVSVNEAAAQICKHIPALLTRRDELFPLARQAVRDSGYPYGKGVEDSCRGFGGLPGGKGFDEEPSTMKRARIDPDKVHIEEEKKKRQDRLEGICDQLRSLGRQQEELKARLQQSRDMHNMAVMPQLQSQLQSQLEHLSTQQMQLINEQSELSKQLRRIDKYCSGGKGQYGRLSSCSEQDKADTDDTDSQLSAYSNNSSPTLSHEAHEDGGPPGGGPTPADVFNMKMASVKKTSAQITKQLVQETLMDEGLRVIKELANQIKSEDELPPPSTTPGRPRGRPPRLDRGDYVGTSRIVQGAPPQNGHHQERSNGVDTNGLCEEDVATENSLNALLALSQKQGILKQEPCSPAANIKMD